MKIGNFYKWVDEDWTFLATDSLIFSIFINEYITFDIYIPSLLIIFMSSITFTS